MNLKANKIKDIREFYFVELKKMFPENEAGSLLDMIFEEYLTMTRIDRHLNPGYRLTEPEMLKVQFAVKELKKNKPIQYILNRSNFYGLQYYVDERVLIPRPETEELVEWIINDNKQLNTGLKILDIGTGSGCIAVSLKKFIPAARVWAMDISAGAIDVAKRNAAKNAVEILFLKQDILRVDNISGAPLFDIIVSNPPYVRESEKAEMSENILKFEPAGALFVEDSDALIYYRQIAKIAMSSLSPSGLLYLEINQNLGGATKDLLKKTGFGNIVLRHDLNGNERMIRACKI